MTESSTIAARVPLVYSGTRGGLSALFYKNVALTIVTVGIYRFWAITNLRAYFWRRWSVNGEPFDYSGTGRELFVGFVKVALIFLGFALAIQGAQALTENLYVSGALSGLYSLVAGGLYVVGSYLALRYRMARTRWRGVAFAQGGRLAGYFWLMVFGWLLTLLTLGAYYPWFQIRRARYVLNHLAFGSVGFRLEASAGGLFLRWILALIVLLALIIVAGALIGIAAALGFGALISTDIGVERASSIAPLLALAGGVLLFGYLFVVSFYKQKLFRTVLDGLTLGSLRFRFDGSVLGLAWLSLGNLLLTWLSLGLLYPLAMHRTQRFWERHLSILGWIDPAMIEQAADRLQGSEGLTGFLGDMDAGFGG